jgi:hypothetical protein
MLLKRLTLILTAGLLWSSCSNAQPCSVGPNGTYGYTNSPDFPNAQVCTAAGARSVVFMYDASTGLSGLFYPGSDIHEFFDQRIAMVQANGVLYAPVRSEGFWTLPCYSQYIACRNNRPPPWPANTCETSRLWQVFDPVTLNWIGQADSGGGPILAKPLFTEFVCPNPTPPVTLTPTPTRTVSSPPSLTPSLTPTAGCFPPFCVSQTPAPSPTRTPTGGDCPCPPTLTPTPTCPPCPPTGGSGKTSLGTAGCATGPARAAGFPLELGLVAGVLLVWRRRD